MQISKADLDKIKYIDDAIDRIDQINRENNMNERKERTIESYSLEKKAQKKLDELMKPRSDLKARVDQLTKEFGELEEDLPMQEKRVEALKLSIGFAKGEKAKKAQEELKSAQEILKRMRAIRKKLVEDLEKSKKLLEAEEGRLKEIMSTSRHLGRQNDQNQGDDENELQN